MGPGLSPPSSTSGENQAQKQAEPVGQVGFVSLLGTLMFHAITKPQSSDHRTIAPRENSGQFPAVSGHSILINQSMYNLVPCVCPFKDIYLFK